MTHSSSHLENADGPLETMQVRRGVTGPPAGRPWVYFGLLWLAGSSLRITVLAIPPVLPSIHRTLHLDEKTVGLLTTLPVLLLAAAAVPGSLLVARLAPRRALILGLGVVCIAGAARGAGSTPLLLAMTFLMGLGIAVSQPSLPSLVRAWSPYRIGQATAVYSNGLLIGEIAAAALTVPLILPLVGGRWQLDLAVWSLPVGLTALAVALCSPHARRDVAAPPVRWWPDWRSARTWRLGLILGCASTIYFGANTFIPDYLKATHHGALISAALTGLNLGQLPSSLLVAGLPGRLVGRRWPFIAAGGLTLLGLVGFLRLDDGAAVVGAGVLGLCSALVLVLNLTLPPLLTEADDVHRLSAAMFTIAYACSFVASEIGGAVWDATGIPATAFAPLAVAAVTMVALALRLTLPHARLEPAHDTDA